MVAFGLFIAIWGWRRFLLDFWPLDRSRVGPSLCASLVVVLLITAHNEYVFVSKVTVRNGTPVELFRDAVDEVLHPMETAEQHIAEYVVDEQELREGVESEEKHPPVKE